MVIALVLLAAWVVLNVAVLGAVAVANHLGRREPRPVAAPVAVAVRRTAAPVGSAVAA